MKRQIAVVVILTITSTVSAADSRTATKFLRAYVDTLCAEKSGDREKAITTITPFRELDGKEMRASAEDVVRGQYGDASIQAEWAIVTNSWLQPAWRFNVGKRERREAVAQLRQCFGPSITDGPMRGMTQVETGAASMAWFLMQEIDPVAQPRNPNPPR